jgi:hypothetical protein
MSYQDYFNQVVLLVARLATILMYSHHRGNSNEDRINRSNGRSKDIIVFIDVNIRNIPYRTNKKMAYHWYRKMLITFITTNTHHT